MHNTNKGASSYRLTTGSPLPPKSDLSTKPSTVEQENEPVPSFLKALNFYQSELSETEDELHFEDILTHSSGIATLESGFQRRGGDTDPRRLESHCSLEGLG